MFHPFRDLPIATLFAAFLTCARHCCVHIIRSLKSIHQPKKKKNADRESETGRESKSESSAAAENQPYNRFVFIVVVQPI